MLQNFNYIRSNKIEKHEVFFDFKLAQDNDVLLFILAKEKSKKLLDYLIKVQEGASKTQISKDLKMHSSTVSSYLEKLEIKGIVIKKKLSRKTIYFLNERRYNDILNSYS